DTAGTCALSVEPVGRYACEYVRGSDEVRATRVAKAGSTGRVVIGQEQREVTRESGRVDLQQVRISHHARLVLLVLPGGSVREACLQAIADSGKGRVLQAA